MKQGKICVRMDEEQIVILRMIAEKMKITISEFIRGSMLGTVKHYRDTVLEADKKGEIIEFWRSGYCVVSERDDNDKDWINKIELKG